MTPSRGEDEPKTPAIPALRTVQAPEVLAQFLREQILTGRFPVGTPLPSEREIAQQSGFGRSTVREAIKMLSPIEKGDENLAKRAMWQHLNAYHQVAARDGAVARTRRSPGT